MSWVQFNNTSFTFHYFSWSFDESYFTRKHIFHEPYRANRTKDYGLKTYKQVPFRNGVLSVNYNFIIAIPE